MERPSTEQSPRLSLSCLTPSQAQKHVTANESFRRLDALVDLAVRSRTIAVERGAPAEGDAYILSAGASGAAWDFYSADAIAVFQEGRWAQIPPGEGWRAWVVDSAEFIVHDGAAWSEISGGASDAAAIFGVSTTADATNRLAVKSDALLSHDDVTPGSGDVRINVNKNGVANTASHLFQIGFSGRAEFGLTGDDDFPGKVSADGAAWSEAIVIDKDYGFVGIGAPPVEAPAEIHFDQSAPTVSHAIFKNNDTGAGAQVRVQLRRGGDAISGIGGGAVWFATAASLGFADDEGRTINFINGPSAGVASARMDITPAGDVGVGTSAPTTKLDVNGPVRVKPYPVASPPSASTSGAGAIIFVSDEAGGALLAFSEGASWRRVTDRAVIA